LFSTSPTTMIRLFAEHSGHYPATAAAAPWMLNVGC